MCICGSRRGAFANVSTLSGSVISGRQIKIKKVGGCVLADFSIYCDSKHGCSSVFSPTRRTQSPARRFRLLLRCFLQLCRCLRPLRSRLLSVIRSLDSAESHCPQVGCCRQTERLLHRLLRCNNIQLKLSNCQIRCAQCTACICIGYTIEMQNVVKSSNKYA